MELTHDVTVAAGIDEAWTALDDLDTLTVCLGDALATLVEGTPGDSPGDSPGVELVQRDDSAHRLVVSAETSRGDGTAAVRVTAVLSPQDTGTRVSLRTDVSGQPEQPREDEARDVADQLAACFADLIDGGTGEASDGSDPALPHMLRMHNIR